MVESNAPTGGAPPVAEVRIRSREREVFLATTAVLSDGLLSATGRWTRPLGDGRELVREQGSYTWPVRELRQVRWLGAAA